MSAEDLLTNDIVETALKADKGKDVKLISWSHENCTKTGDNFFNVVKRLKVRYSNGENECNTSYVSKLNPCKPNDAFNPYRQRAVAKEIFFYVDFLPLLNLELQKMGEENLRVPKYFHSSMEVEKEVIVLEDLSLRGFETFPRTSTMDEAHTKLMANELARFHAACISLIQNNLQNQNITSIYPLLEESWIEGDTKLRNAFDEVFKKGAQHNLNLVKALEEFKDFIPWLQDIKNKEMETICTELESTPTWTGICHGDYHRTNLLFRYDNSRVPQEVMLIDWQTIRKANIASEFDYLLHSSYFGQSREMFSSVLLKTFYEKFSKLCGSQTPFTLENLEKEVKQNNFGLLVCFFLVPLSICANDPSELFLVDAKEQKTSEEDNLKMARHLLKTKPKLSDVMQDYLHAISKSKLMK